MIKRYRAYGDTYRVWPEYGPVERTEYGPDYADFVLASDYDALKRQFDRLQLIDTTAASFLKP